MDTFKDKQVLDDLYNSGKAPWEVWKAAGEKTQKAVPVAVQSRVEKIR
jgi:hypothetical protein